MDPSRLLAGVTALLAVGLHALSASGFTGQPKPAPTLTKKSAVVDHVADGDTIAVRVGGRDEDIRFIGIDTPEVYFGVECGGPQASASMKRMLGPGDRVAIWFAIARRPIAIDLDVCCATSMVETGCASRRRPSTAC
jgi:endonuclease YncB( thermonuclease family)